MKFRKAAYLAARVSGEDNPDLRELCEERKALPTGDLTKRAFAVLAPYFAPYLKELTVCVMDGIWDAFFSEVKRIREERRKVRPKVRQSGRVYPLALTVYHHFAKYVWEKKGKPFLDKNPAGVKWGSAQEVGPTFGYTTSSSHFIGCAIRTNVRGKRFLKLSIAADRREP